MRADVLAKANFLQKGMAAIPAPLLLLHLFFVSFLAISMILAGGKTYLPYIAAYLVCICFSYFLLNSLFSKFGMVIDFDKFSPNLERLQYISVLLLILCSAFVVAHFVSLGRIPILSILNETDYYEVIRSRQETYFGLPGPVRYGVAWVIKGIAPILILYFFFTKRWAYYAISLILFLLYALAMMAKFYVLCLFVPIVIALFVSGQFKASILHLALAVIGSAFLIWVANAPLSRNQQSGISAEAPSVLESPRDLGPVTVAQETKRAGRWFGDVMYQRIFVVPGEITTEWFNTFPAQHSYFGGCGYSFLKRVLACQEAEDPSTIMYNRLYPDLHNNKGLKGNAPAANFVMAYANLGVVGIVIEAILTGLVLVLCGVALGKSVFLIPLNLIPVVMLNEAAVTTVVLTHAWAITIGLSLVFRRGLEATATPQGN